jgi:hypothetical protein
VPFEGAEVPRAAKTKSVKQPVKATKGNMSADTTKTTAPLRQTRGAKAAVCAAAPKAVLAPRRAVVSESAFTITGTALFPYHIYLIESPASTDDDVSVRGDEEPESLTLIAKSVGSGFVPPPSFDGKYHKNRRILLTRQNSHLSH